MSVLDHALAGILDSHTGPEPRVWVWDVRDILLSVIRPDEDDVGISVAQVADRASVSTRTVYRVLTPEVGKDSISLDLADKLCRACGAHVKVCRLVWPDKITAGDYVPFNQVQ
jgi:hypothetical protein